MAYASLAELKQALRIVDTVDDVLLQRALDSASELIDRHCQRSFSADEAATTRTFDPVGNVVPIDDVYTITDLVVASELGTVIPAAVAGVSGGYELRPRWAPSVGEPWTSLAYSGLWGAAWGSWWSTGINVTARWGYAAEVPASIVQATLLQAGRLFSRRQSPYGVAGSPELGSELRLLAKVDPDVAVLLSPFVKLAIV